MTAAPIAMKPARAAETVSELAPEAALFWLLLTLLLDPLAPGEEGDGAASAILLTVVVLRAIAEPVTNGEVAVDDELCTAFTASRPWLRVLTVEHWLLAGAGCASGVAAFP